MSRGDVYAGHPPFPEPATHEIIRGDAREVMAGLETGSVGIIATDPPFGVPMEWQGVVDWHIGDKDMDQTLALLRWFFAESARVLSEEGWLFVCLWDSILVDGFQAAVAAGFSVQSFAWVKPGKSTPGASTIWEQAFYPCLIGWRSPAIPPTWPRFRNWIELPSVEAKRHPTEKPFELMRYVLQNCPVPVLNPERGAADITVLDPFAGSGTTAVAAKSLGMSSISIELDPTWCEIARWRLDRPLGLELPGGAGEPRRVVD